MPKCPLILISHCRGTTACKAYFGITLKGGFGADTGPSRSDPSTRAFRPKQRFNGEAIWFDPVSQSRQSLRDAARHSGAARLLVTNEGAFVARP